MASCGYFRHQRSFVFSLKISVQVTASCRYCSLITSGNLTPAPPLPPVCYSMQTLSIAADLIKVSTGEVPMLEELEGLPCRTGLLDAPFLFLHSLLPNPDPHHHAHILPSTSPVLKSPLVAAFLSVLASPDTSLLDLSPSGAIWVPRILGRMIGTTDGVAVLTDSARVKRLVGLLAPQHISALLVWPINSGGNRKGVTDLVNAVCLALTHSFTVVANDMGARDHRRIAAEAKLLVRHCKFSVCLAEVMFEHVAGE